MYLSNYTLSLKDAYQLKVTDTYSIHRIVYDMFNEKDHLVNRILFADKGLKRGERKILILSSHIPAKPEIGTIETKEIPDNFLNFENYKFEIVINPVCSCDHKRIPICNVYEILRWFKDKCGKYGFNVLDVELLSNDVDIFQKDASTTITLAKAKLAGVLEVKVSALFKETFRSGIGRGKAFGCGLLELFPAYF